MQRRENSNGGKDIVTCYCWSCGRKGRVDLSKDEFDDFDIGDYLCPKCTKMFLEEGGDE